jgi:Tfp pilus assembly protein PilF
MSLLIKALATAEKDKQKAGKSGGMASLSADALALSQSDTQTDHSAVFAAGSDEKADDNRATQFTLSSDRTAVRDAGLSLAQEAGLISASVKLKEGMVTKPSAQPAKSGAKQISKTDAFNEAAMASVANLKAQGNVAKDSRQRAAASAFVANQSVKTASSRSALLLLGVAGALLILLGLQGYQYFQRLVADEVVVVRPAPPVVQAADVEAVEGSVASDEVVSTVTDKEAGVAEQAGPELEVNAGVLGDAGVQGQRTNDAEKSGLEKQKAGANVDNRVLADTLVADESKLPTQKFAAASTRKQASVDEGNQRETQVFESKEPLRLVSKTPAAGVDPTLLAAYEAFNRGDDSSAQQKYRQVLQKDVRNVDALLGMAAIAQRQNRNMDAMGWYRKVTEIEPRNSIAQSAMADLESNADAVGAGSKIKNMLVRQPESANLHAALGNLYAAQNQWAAAQSAYFNASQYAPMSADYAFNLAISLEHLGKPNLALVQYQRALDLLNITGATSPDRAQVEARIHALQ